MGLGSCSPVAQHLFTQESSGVATRHLPVAAPPRRPVVLLHQPPDLAQRDQGPVTKAHR